MKVVVSISGRDAVPVRALPYVTGWRISPDALTLLFEKPSAYARATEGLRAFQFDEEDGHPIVLPVEWQQISLAFMTLARQLRNKAGEGNVPTYALWRREAIACLPQRCFVWRDEFESTYRAGDTIVPQDPLNDQVPPLNFSPLVPDDMRALVMEGFACDVDALKVSGMTSGNWPWGTHETKLLRALAEAAERFWARYDPSDPTTAPTNEDIVRWLEDRAVSNNLAKAIASILRADGLPPGPRK